MNQELRHTIHFSIAEAIETLHTMKPLIQRMRELSKRLLQEGYDIYHMNISNGFGNNGHGEISGKMEMLIDILKKLISAGIQIKGLEEGLVDFPHIRSTGEEVYLCYKYGEESINYWHRIDAGFAGRQPLSSI
jgi:hypothetical protein